MRLLIAAIVFVGLMALMFADWRGERGDTVDVIGSTSVMPFAEMLAEQYAEVEKTVTVDVQGGGSTVGVSATLNGYADLGMCSRSLKKEEADLGLAPITIALDGLAIVVHPSNPVSELTKEQVRKMFAGELSDWSAVGGKPGPVRLIVREESSGTREAFGNLIMGKSRVSRKALNQDSNGAIKELVKADAAAIGFMSLGLVTEELKALRIDGAEPTKENVMNKRYPLVRPFLFIHKGELSVNSKKFVEYVLSAAGQDTMEKEGLVRVK